MDNTIPSAPMPDRLVDALVEKAEAEAAKARAEEREMRAEARQREVEARDMELNERQTKAQNRYHQEYLFARKVDEASVKQCIYQLNEWSRTDPGCNVTIIFNSPGGDIIYGMMLFDYIQVLRRKGHTVTTVALGEAMSMAGILVQAGDVRAMGKESWLMIHQASFGAFGSTYEIEDMVEFVKRIQQRILNIFVNRSKLTRAQLKARWSRKNWYVDSDEALELGLVDEVW